MKLNESLLLMLMLMVGIAPGSALPQSVTAMVAGRVIGLPSGNVPSFEVVLVSNGAPCAVLKAHVLADGSFRFSSIRAGNYFVAVEGLSDGYGINTMTAGTVDLLFDSMRIVADAPTPVLIEIARFEEIRRKPSVMHVGDSLRSQCLIHQVKPLYSSQAKAAHVVGVGLPGAVESQTQRGVVDPVLLGSFATQLSPQDIANLEAVLPSGTKPWLLAGGNCLMC